MIATRGDADAPPQAMVVHPRYLCFSGSMGSVPPRMMGAVTILVSQRESFLFRHAGRDWERRFSAVVEPFARHEFSADHPFMGALMIEPEVVDVRQISGLHHRLDLMQDLLSHLAQPGTLHGTGPWTVCAERFVAALGERRLDVRIAATVERIRDRPWSRFAAEECAARVGLSFSRFLHLFRAETGVTFRRFVAWKRARLVLENLRDPKRLTDIALSAGYPDSSRFSHCLREFYGLRPRDMFARCDRISLSVARSVKAYA